MPPDAPGRPRGACWRTGHPYAPGPRVNIQPPPSSPPVQPTSPRRLRWLVAGGVALIGLVAVLRLRPPAATPRPATVAAVPASLAEALGDGDDFTARPGPWGELRFVRITLERPDEFVSLPSGPVPQPEWLFAGYQPAQVRDLIEKAALPPAQAAGLLDQGRWQIRPDGVTLHPPPETVAALSRDARALIYGALSDFQQNSAQFHAFRYRRDRLEEWLDRSELSEPTVAALRGLLYPQGEAECFADYFEVMGRIPDPAEKRRFLKTLSRESSLLVKLRVTPDTDTAALARYWERGGRAKGIGPLLESLRRVPGGAEIDIVHLLPPFARRLLYTFPFPSNEPIEQKRDCTWTALNFLAEAADDRYCDGPTAMRELGTAYYPIKDAPTFGDIICLLDANRRVLHTAVYIADRIVFTKNGGYFTQPWLLMDFRDMEARYSSAKDLRVEAYRLKRL